MFEENLDKDASDTSDLSELSIKFVLAADSRESASVAGVQAADVFAQATEGVSAFGPMPRTVRFTTSAIGTATNVVTKAQTFANTWNVLLERMELLNRIVADITQVSNISSLDSSLLSDR